MKQWNKEQLTAFGVLALRWYLAYYMFSYGYGKLFGEQFGVYDKNILNTPLKNVDTFHLLWHLFSKSAFFNYAVGGSQILGAFLIIYKRTVLYGAFILLPILANIWLIDVCFMSKSMKIAFGFRLGFMMLSDFIILWYYRPQVVAALKLLRTEKTVIPNNKWWLLLLMPIVGFLMDFVWLIVKAPLKWITYKLLD